MPRAALKLGPRCPPFWRALLGLAVLALLLADVWRVPHLLLVRHQVCKEHGELVHEHDGRAARSTEPAELARTATPASPESHHHDHCGLVATLGRSTAVLTVSSVTAKESGASTSTLLTFRAAAVPDSGRVLPYAPKQSPPV